MEEVIDGLQTEEVGAVLAFSKPEFYLWLYQQAVSRL